MYQNKNSRSADPVEQIKSLANDKTLIWEPLIINSVAAEIGKRKLKFWKAQY